MSDEPTPPEPTPPEQGGGRQVSVHVDDDQKHGIYANFLVVSHSPHEFTLDFCQVLPSGQEGKARAEVVSRVKIAPTMVGKVMKALNTNMTSYEDKYGMVKDVG